MEADLTRALVNDHKDSKLKVYIAEGGTSVYQDEVLQIAKSDNDTFSPILLLFPTKLGKVDTTEDYQKSVKETFKLSQSVGIAG